MPLANPLTLHPAIQLHPTATKQPRLGFGQEIGDGEMRKDT